MNHAFHRLFSQVPICLWLTTIFFLPLALISCNNKSVDKLTVSVSSTDTLPDFPSTLQGQKLKRHILQMSAFGEDAEENYQSSLTELRKDTAMNVVVFEIYRNTKEEQYVLRSLLVETLKELRFHTSLQTLSGIASSPIPPERSGNPEYSTHTEEIIIRTTAIEGISYLAQDQNLEAKRTLRGLIDNEDLTLRQIAIRGYLSSLTSDKELQEEINKLKNELPKEDHWMITNKETVIKTVPHPEMPDSFDLKKAKPNIDSPKAKN